MAIAGVPGEVLVDNQKTAGITHRRGGAVQFHPRFVEQEFGELLTCGGVLAHGFTWLRCADCTLERLVALRLRFLPIAFPSEGSLPSVATERY